MHFHHYVLVHAAVVLLVHARDGSRGGKEGIRTGRVNQRNINYDMDDTSDCLSRRNCTLKRSLSQRSMSARNSSIALILSVSHSRECSM